MSYSWKGAFNTMNSDVKDDIEIDRYGVAGATQYFWGPYEAAAGFVISKVRHDVYSWLYRSKAKITRQEANSAQVDIGYAGIPPETDQRTYQTSGATSTEPIETHPTFSVWGIEENGAKFDDEGKFVGFTDKANTKYGIKSYLSGNINFAETRVLGKLVNGNDLSKLGEIDTPPAVSCRPATKTGRNWLLITGTLEQVGETGGKVTKGWRLSAKRGFDTDIYS